MYYARNDRLISDSFARAIADEAGIDMAVKFGKPYVVKLNGLSCKTLKGLFASVVNFFDPPRHLQDFLDDDIVGNDTFRQFRDMLNRRGLDIQTSHGFYTLGIRNISYNRGNLTPTAYFRIVPWDGVVKPLEAFDVFRHIPGKAGPAPFY